jgi:integrase
VALEISIYNLQTKTSKDGKTYRGYTPCFTPGQAGRTSEANQLPPFYVRERSNKQGWIRLQARTLGEAQAEALTAQNHMEAVAKGVQVAPTVKGEQSRVHVVIETYLQETEAIKSIASYNAYRRSLELFQESCRRPNIESVDRNDLLAFRAFLKRVDKFSDRSIYNHFVNTLIFFRWCKTKAKPKIAVNFELTKHDWPPMPERDPEAYEDEEIEALMNNTDEDGRLLLKAFLYSGLRDGEMAHLTYGDIDVNNSVWRVQPKKDHSLKTKDAQREVPVAGSLTKKIVERKKALHKTDADLVFPAPRGGVDEHLIRIVKRAAKKAGMEGRIDDHKFRSTAITIWLRNGCTVPDIMEWVGHRKPETILRYAAKVKLRNKSLREKITAPFEQYATMGD